MKLNDIELLIAYQRDADEHAFAQLVERHGHWIFAAARRRLGDDHLADEPVACGNQTTELRDGADAIPDAFLVNSNQSTGSRGRPNAEAAGSNQIKSILKESVVMAEQQAPSQGGHQMISAEFLVKDVEANLAFFEKLGFPRRFIDKPDASGQIPRASLTAGQMGKIWIRRAPEPEIRPSPSINVFFWIKGGPEGLIAHRMKLADSGVPVTPIIDQHGLPNFNVKTPDGYSIAFFTQYVPPGEAPVVMLR